MQQVISINRRREGWKQVSTGLQGEQLDFSWECAEGILSSEMQSMRPEEFGSFWKNIARFSFAFQIFLLWIILCVVICCYPCTNFLQRTRIRTAKICSKDSLRKLSAKCTAFDATLRKFANRKDECPSGLAAFQRIECRLGSPTLGPTKVLLFVIVGPLQAEVAI